jgi:hypothetical protein
MMRTMTEEEEAQAVLSGYLQSQSTGDVEGSVAKALLQPIVISLPGFSFFVHSQETRSDYALEKAAFQRMLPDLSGMHAGKFVAVHGGRIWGSDTSRNTLVSRFFAENPHGTSVYIGFIGPRPIVHLPTPIVRKRS